MSFTEKLSLWIRETDLNEDELLDLGTIYTAVLLSHEDIVALAVAYKEPIAQVYWECKRSQRLIAERIKTLRKLAPPEAVRRQEMG